MPRHSKGDDFRAPEEIELWRARDPLLLAERGLAAADVERVVAECARIVDDAVEQASRLASHAVEAA